MNKHKILNDFCASIEILQTNIKAYHAGRKNSYRVIAVELRKLLCDKQKGNDVSLAPKILGTIKLHPLRGKQAKIDKNTTLYIPGRIYFNGKGKVSIDSLFNESLCPLELGDWLEQKLHSLEITVREFIRSVADKEGAHADDNFNTTLQKTKSVVLASDDFLSSEIIIAIGEYVLKMLIKGFSEAKKNNIIKYINQNILPISSYVKKAYKANGRGAIVIKLCNYIKGVENINFPYYLPKQFCDFFKKDKMIQKKVDQFIQNYDADKEFLMLIVDFNNELWLYQQKIKNA